MNTFDFTSYFKEAAATLSRLGESDFNFEALAAEMVDSLSKDGTIFWFGNGGSASDSLHLSAELVGRFARDRRPLRSIALNANQSNLTAIGNDFGFEQIFVRQIQGLGRKGDVAIGITTSGKSQNVLLALKAAKQMGLITALFTGADFKAENENLDFIFMAPSSVTAHIQECHITLGQALCGYIENRILDENG